jgi:hypothetical protein
MLRALHYGDIKEELEAGIALLLIDIKPDILKARVHIAAKGRIPYYTFISKEAVEALLCYFNKRKRYYGDIGEDEHVFIPEAKSGRIA